mmetsp:Transcript_14157/g.39017  ORF Transcript_14157/g.39017 Transcript_14157/m.39017 type:complete len:287 (-) Transcript_14157:277-1137(-)
MVVWSAEELWNVVLSVEEQILQILLNPLKVEEHDLVCQSSRHERKQQIHDELHDAGHGSRKEQLQAIRVSAHKSFEHFYHEGWVWRWWVGGIRNADKVGDPLWHVLDTDVSHDDERVDLGVDIRVPRLAVGSQPQNWTAVLRKSMPVHGTVVERGDHGLCFCQFLRVLHGLRSGFWTVGKVDQFSHLWCALLFSPLHHARELLQGILDRSSDGGVLGVGLGGNGEDVGVAEVCEVLWELGCQLRSDEGELLLSHLEGSLAADVVLQGVLEVIGVAFAADGSLRILL